MDGKSSTSKNSSISTLTYPYSNSTNEKVYSLQGPIHDNIKHPEWSKSQSRAVMRARDIMKTPMKVWAHKTWHFVILEYSLILNPHKK